MFSIFLWSTLRRALGHLWLAIKDYIWLTVRTLFSFFKGNFNVGLGLGYGTLDATLHDLYGQNINGAQELGVFHQLFGDYVWFFLEHNAHGI